VPLAYLRCLPHRFTRLIQAAILSILQRYCDSVLKAAFSFAFCVAKIVLLVIPHMTSWVILSLVFFVSVTVND